MTMVDQLKIDYEVAEKMFVQYHEDNPHIYAAFKNITLQTIERGFKNYSARTIIEVCRWYTSCAAEGDKFKINNNYTPFYARLFVKEFPQHKDFFRMKQSKFDEQ